MVKLARRTCHELAAAREIIRSIPFSGETRISGADLNPRGEIREAAGDAIRAYANPGANYHLARILEESPRWIAGVRERIQLAFLAFDP